jgi:iron only hydrogenase large subunit-like protein
MFIFFHNFFKGWICYAEKTHGDWILPYLSRVKSPQQIAGSLIKDYLTSNLKIPPSRIAHITVHIIT